MSNSDIFSLGGMIEQMKLHESRKGNLPERAYATAAYIKTLERGVEDISLAEATTQPPEGAMAQLLGMPIHLSTALPKGVLCIFMGQNNQPLGMIVDETYEKQHPSRDSDAADE